MYQRKAHILFVASRSAVLDMACELLQQEAGDWLEGERYELSMEPSPSSAQREWADLLVALDEASCMWLEANCEGRPGRCWGLPQDDGLIMAYLRTQLSSMAAGMRMMQRQGD